MKSKELLSKIDATYGKRSRGRPQVSYDKLCSSHMELINSITGWVPVTLAVPNIGEQVFAIEDLSSLGKGVFISNYYYVDCGFVANEGDDDAYGYITHWVTFSTIDAS